MAVQTLVISIMVAKYNGKTHEWATSSCRVGGEGIASPGHLLPDPTHRFSLFCLEMGPEAWVI